MNDGLEISTESQGHYAALLAMLLLLIVGLPLLHEFGLGTPWVANLLFLAVIASCIAATVENRRWIKVLVGLGLLTLAAGWGQLLERHEAVVTADHVLRAVFLLLCSGLILRYVVQGGAVTLDRILAALCVYLLLGLVWAEFYGLVHVYAPDSFHFATEEAHTTASAVAHRSRTVYFSFVTMTTLGYGDITPTSGVTRSLAIVQATVGQIYLTVLVARLVGLHIAHGQPGRPGGRQADA
ncbi:MAG: potassium channel family protein [Planctomycetota bacterium]